MRKNEKRRSKGKLVYFLDRLVSHRLRINIQLALPIWIGSLLAGLIAVGYTLLFGIAEDLLHAILRWNRWIILVVTPASFLLAYAIVKMFAPNARGSGIPQVMAAIELSSSREEHSVSRLLSFRIILAKIASTMVMVMGGGAVGREGPTIQIAGSVLHIVKKWIPRSWPHLSTQSFILTGAAAGLAAAFNTPLGGVVFAMEELAKIHIRFFRTALFSGVIIAGLTAQGILGPYLYLGYPDVRNLEYSIYLAVAATAIVSGMLGSLMCRIILRIMKWKRAFTTLQTILFILLTGLAVALVAFFFNDQVLGSGKELMNGLLFTRDKSVSWHTMLLRIAGPIISFNSGAAGGVFAPSLAAGAGAGAFLAGLFEFTGTNANIMILSGMVGFLTGVTRTPFTSAILVLEMTDRHSVIFHLMLAALLSNVAALIIDRHSFYEQLKKTYLEDAAPAPAAPA